MGKFPINIVEKLMIFNVPYNQGKFFIWSEISLRDQLLPFLILLLVDLPRNKISFSSFQYSNSIAAHHHPSLFSPFFKLPMANIQTKTLNQSQKLQNALINLPISPLVWKKDVIWALEEVYLCRLRSNFEQLIWTVWVYRQFPVEAPPM